MKLSTGKVAFPIEFDNGDKDCIYFNPNDPQIAVRMNDLQDKIKEKIKGLDDIDLNNEGNPKETDKISQFKKMIEIFYEEFDYAFGGDVSAVVFKYCSPFAIINGEYFVFQFLNAITPEIKKHIDKASADRDKKMAKYLDKYKK